MPRPPLSPSVLALCTILGGAVATGPAAGSTNVQGDAGAGGFQPCPADSVPRAPAVGTRFTYEVVVGGTPNGLRTVELVQQVEGDRARYQETMVTATGQELYRRTIDRLGGAVMLGFVEPRTVDGKTVQTTRRFDHGIPDARLMERLRTGEPVSLTQRDTTTAGARTETRTLEVEIVRLGCRTVSAAGDSHLVEVFRTTQRTGSRDTAPRIFLAEVSVATGWLIRSESRAHDSAIELRSIEPPAP